jgi:type IV pilus assembly protein PilE
MNQTSLARLRFRNFIEVAHENDPLDRHMPNIKRLPDSRLAGQRPGGFTLIEVTVAGVIVAVLAAIALPSYSDYVQRSKISEAVANLSDMRTRLEQFYLDNRSYPTAPADCIPFVAGAAAPAGKIYLPAQQKYFDVRCTAMSAAAYTVTASGRPAEGMSASFVYTTNEANARTSAGPQGSYTSSTCWATRRDGSC